MPLNREEATKKAKEVSQQADMKQHADKLIQGFEKLNESHSKRAIWELFQNAIDISNHCEIIIELCPDFLVFNHNGNLFNSKTLSCLIKQVSSKSQAKNDDDEVGQYGTGFISTHSFGKKFFLTGCLEEDGFYIPFNDFEIDRIAADASQLIEKLFNQQERIYDLINNNETVTEKTPLTTFSYQTISDLEKSNAIKAIELLPDILPYVMTLNKKLYIVKVISGEIITQYKKGKIYLEDGVCITQVQINDNIKNIYSLVSDDEQIVVILPLFEKDKTFIFDDNISRLFLYYPLIGTEKFGFNFIIHSKQFAPTEPRDGIHLKSQNEQVQEKEMHNRQIIEIASKMIFEFIERNVATTQNPINLSSINFNTSSGSNLLNEYFTDLKKQWINKFKTFPLIETFEERLSPENVYFFSDQLLLDENYYDAIYNILKLLWKEIPQKEIAKEWTYIVKEWDDESIKFIKINDIISKIANAGSLDSFSNEEDLFHFYEYLIEYGHGDVFNKFNLLPNIKNEFCILSNLYSTQNIDDILIEIADVLIPDLPKKFVKPLFKKLELKLAPYDRKQFSKDISSQVIEIYKDLSLEKLMDIETLNALMNYSRLFADLDDIGIRGVLLPYICNYYIQDISLIHFPTIPDQGIDQRTPFKYLVKNFLLDISCKDKDWVQSNISLLNSVLELVYNFKDYEDLITTIPVFPNQLFALCKINDLNIDNNIPEELKDLYDNIIIDNSPVRSAFIHNDFSKFLKDTQAISPKQIAEYIEEVFRKEMSYEDINQHPHKKEILNIINKITGDIKWSTYFSEINLKKELILMATITDEKTKNDLFSIIGLDGEKIALLGKLARNNNLEKIIELGNEAVEEEKRNKTDFQFKKFIGVHIENIVRQKIGQELTAFNVRVREEQDGQDIIVELNDNIIYLIEVKSRWNIKNSITLSPKQMQKSVFNKDKYSLICVEMCDYKPGQEERYNVSDINEILDRINILNDIGNRIEPLISGLMKTDDENAITITGDYRAVIPQSLVSIGEPMTKFINLLISIINSE